MENKHDAYSQHRTCTEHESLDLPLWRKLPDEGEDKRDGGEQCEKSECRPWLGGSYWDVTLENESVCDHVEDEQGSNGYEVQQDVKVGEEGKNRRENA